MLKMESRLSLEKIAMDSPNNRQKLRLKSVLDRGESGGF